MMCSEWKRMWIRVVLTDRGRRRLFQGSRKCTGTSHSEYVNRLCRGVHRHITPVKVRFSEDSCTESSGNHWWGKLSMFVQQRGWKPFFSEPGQRRKREVKEIIFKSLGEKKTWSNGSWQLKDWKKNNKMVFQIQWINIMERMRLDMQENMTVPKKRQTAAWETSCRREWGSCYLSTQRFGSGVKLETVTLISSEMIPLTVHWEKGRTEVDVRKKST